MSNKPHNKLNSIDRQIRDNLPTGMNDGTHLKIEFFSGFELFNTRPYHNYETWSDGYRVTDVDLNFSVEAEDLDDAIRQWIIKRKSITP